MIAVIAALVSFTLILTAEGTEGFAEGRRGGFASAFLGEYLCELCG